VRLGLVLSEVGRANNITIVQDDLNRAVMAEARRYPGQEHLVLQYFQKNADALNGLRAPIFEDKVIDFILELAKVTEEVVSIEELRKDPDDEPAVGTAEAAPKPKKKAAKKKVAAEE
jgi:trigger factor